MPVASSTTLQPFARPWREISDPRVPPLILAAFAAALLCLVSTVAEAQLPVSSPPDSTAQGAFPDASFDVLFRKFTPPTNAFSPFYSWDAHMAMDLTLGRAGVNSVNLAAIAQTVGTENFGSRVSVGGTGYVIRLSYARAWSEDSSLSMGVSHLSSHLTRDLDTKTAEARAAGLPIPVVGDPHEYNAVFLQVTRRFPTSRLAPSIELAVEPINLRFNGRPARPVRPVYLATRLTLWQGHEKSLKAESQHEIGTRSWNQVSLFLALFAKRQAEGRLQLFLSVSPGHRLHVSPMIGGVRDGVSCGARLTFQSS